MTETPTGTSLSGLMDSMARRRADYFAARAIFLADAWWGAGDDPDALFEIGRELIEALEALGLTGAAYDIWLEDKRQNRDVTEVTR